MSGKESYRMVALNVKFHNKQPWSIFTFECEIISHIELLRILLG